MQNQKFELLNSQIATLTSQQEYLKSRQTEFDSQLSQFGARQQELMQLMQQVAVTGGSPKMVGQGNQVKQQMQMIAQMQTQLNQRFVSLQKSQWEGRAATKTVDTQLELLKSLQQHQQMPVAAASTQSLKPSISSVMDALSQPAPPQNLASSESLLKLLL